ncbi:MAG: hypothetical protein ACO2PO_15710 [Candidatus Calescibacterium sp.]
MRIRVWKRGEKKKRTDFSKIFIPPIIIRTRSDYVDVLNMKITAEDIDYHGISLKKVSPTEFVLTIKPTKSSQKSSKLKLEDLLDAGVGFWNAEEIYVDIPIEKILFFIFLLALILIGIGKLLK